MVVVSSPRRVFMRIDPDAFEVTFIAWVKTLAVPFPPGTPEVVAIDGKTLRRSFERGRGLAALHVVSAWANEQRLVLGQRRVDGKKPRRLRRGFQRLFEKVQRRITGFLSTMMLNIPTNCLRCHVVTDRAGKIAIVPEFSAPKTPLDAWKFLKNRPRTEVFEKDHHWRNGITRWKGTEQMHMIRTHFHLLKSHILLLRNIGKQFPNPLLNLPLQDIAPVLRRPDQIVQGIVNGMRGTSENHADNVAHRSNLSSGHGARRQDRSFPPAASSRAA